ncbi:hypothetical protein BN2475_1470006 [Paraburkholderia ribeironis]|uniref:Uncharacterized protein n=1 Tax=Paraburkholderia ribeironis TaxID=1247936 RepID=A0A1N7SQD6_9BURK|nr:hypothetical protein BN2475_1470006 [Paraburkholderia ribeironis]
MFATPMFLATVKHTAVNNAMLDGYGFVHNGALAMNAAPPTEPNVTNEIGDPLVARSVRSVEPIQHDSPAGRLRHGRHAGRELSGLG